MNNVYSGGQIVEDVLASGLSAKLIRYLRIRSLGEPNRKDANHSIERKLASATSVRGKEEVRNRFRHVSENFQLDAPRIIDGVVGDQITEKDNDRNFIRPSYQPWNDGDAGESPDRLADDDNYGDDSEGCDGWHIQDLRGKNEKSGDRHGQGRSLREEDFDDGGEDSSKCRLSRGLVKSGGRWKINGVVDAKHGLASPGTGRGQESRTMDMAAAIGRNSRSITDVEGGLVAVGDAYATEIEDNDDCFQECRIGSKDISDLVKKAVRAAEAEARAAAAPAEAIKAAGDSAAEVVKTAAMEVSCFLFHPCLIFETSSISEYYLDVLWHTKAPF